MLEPAVIYRKLLYLFHPKCNSPLLWLVSNVFSPLLLAELGAGLGGGS